MDDKMKRKIVYLSVFLLVMAMLPVLLMKRTGSLWPESQPDPGVVSTEQTRQVFHKWQDKHGQWHFGEEVPEGVTAVAVEIDTAANVIQSVRAPSSAAVQEKKTRTEPAAAIPGLPMTVNPADIPKLMDDARDIEQLLNQRQQSIDAAR